MEDHSHPASRAAVQIDIAERAVDEVLTRLSSLLTVAPNVAEPLARAREALIDAHRALARVAVQIGAEAVLAGPVDKPEDQPRRPPRKR